MTRRGFAPEALIQHGFLGGRVHVNQPREGYRSGVDAVYLAAAAPAKSGESVLDLGAGAGVASFCLAARINDLDQYALEVEEAYAALARANAAETGLPLTVHHGDVEDAPLALRARSFDGVIANPPYYRATAGPVSETRDAAHRERVPLDVWIDCALRRLTPGGWLVFIQRADRLSEVLIGLNGRAGDVCVKPLAGRLGRAASRVIVKARKGARGPLTLCAPLIEHEGPEHLRDGDDYSDQARAILRHGEALDF